MLDTGRTEPVRNGPRCCDDSHPGSSARSMTRLSCEPGPMDLRAPAQPSTPTWGSALLAPMRFPCQPRTCASRTWSRARAFGACTCRPPRLPPAARPAKPPVRASTASTGARLLCGPARAAATSRTSLSLRGHWLPSAPLRRALPRGGSPLCPPHRTLLDHAAAYRLGAGLEGSRSTYARAGPGRQPLDPASPGPPGPRAHDSDASRAGRR